MKTSNTPFSPCLWACCAWALALTACELLPGIHVDDLYPLDEPKNPNAAWYDIPLGQFPLNILGDINLDGKIDSQDGDLIKQYAESPDESSMEGTCRAAADLTEDGLVTQGDYELFLEFFADGDIIGYPVTANPTMTCDAKTPLFCARMDAHPGDSIPIKLLSVDYKFEDIDFNVEGDFKEIEYLPEENTWNIYTLDNAKAPSTLFIDIHVGLDLHLYHTVPIFPAPTPTLDTVTTPALTPPVMPDCPQRGKGCEALVIDFLHNLRLTPDIRSLPASLTRVGCNTTHVTPKFQKVPQSWTIGKGAFSYTFHPDPIDSAKKVTLNKAEWGRIKGLITAYKTTVSGGKELAFQTVAAHGSSGSNVSCGTWSPGFYTGDYMFRSVFNLGNYLSAKGKVCGQIMHDISCYSGLTPKNLPI